MPNRYETDHNVGEDNFRAYGMDIHHPVFLVSAGLVVLFVISTLLVPHAAKETFDASKAFAIKNFDWLFALSANVFVLFCLALLVSPFRHIRLGGQDAKPEFSTLSWLAMLFAAGMGIGLMFWAVAEPTGYYTDWYGTPLGVEAHTEEAKRLALGATLFHWGLHPWAIYAVVALALAFFCYNKNLPLTLRSGFFPFLGERAWGFWGHVIDTVAVLATIFGLATSLGFGAIQSAAGLDYLFGVGAGLRTQLAVIICVTGVATISVVRGLHGGVKLLSNLNIAGALLLLCFVIIAGPTGVIFNSVATTVVSYLGNILPLSNWINRNDPAFFHGWTIFYWAWWISWSPFVGMFIARVSRGRTVGQFLLAVLVVPTLVTALWMGAFGGSALYQITQDIGPLAAHGITAVELTLFQMLQEFPLASFASFMSITLVLCFFVTSSDSGSLVIDSITAGGKLDAPVPQRVFWACMEGLIAVALIVGGGKDALGALQAAAITVGLPFCVVLLLLCVSLVKGLMHEYKFVIHKAHLKSQG